MTKRDANKLVARIKKLKTYPGEVEISRMAEECNCTPATVKNYLKSWQVEKITTPAQGLDVPNMKFYRSGDSLTVSEGELLIEYYPNGWLYTSDGSMAIRKELLESHGRLCAENGIITDLIDLVTPVR